MISNVPAVLPPQNTQVVGENNQITIPWMGFLRALFQRTGNANGIFPTIGSINLDANPDSVLQFDITIISKSHAAENCFLFNMQPAQSQMIVNQSANPVNVFPANSSDTIDGGASFSLTNGKSQIFTCLETQGTIISLQL